MEERDNSAEAVYVPATSCGVQPHTALRLPLACRIQDRAKPRRRALTTRFELDHIDRLETCRGDVLEWLCSFGYSRRPMGKNWRTSIWRVFELGMVIGIIGLVACDDGSMKDGSVFERDGSRVAPIEPAAQNLPVSDPGPDAISEVLLDADAFSRARRLGTLLPTLGPEPVQQVKEIFANPMLARHIGATEIELLSRYWAAHEPEAASIWAVEESPPAYRVAALFSAYPEWAKTDPFAALDAAEDWMERRDVRDSLPIALVLGWYSAGDPPELQTYMRGLGVSFGRQRVLSTYIRTKLRTEGPDAVMRWAEAIAEDETRYKLAAYRQVGYGMVPYDLDAALSWCDAHCEGPYGDGLRKMVVQGWLLMDPAAALEWLISSAPEGDEARFALRVSYSTWMQMDPDAAMQWIEDQVSGQPPAELIPTYPIYARVLARDEPARAIPFAELILDEIDRELLLIHMATDWRAQDEAACEAWLEQSPLSEEAREQVRSAEAAAS